jgi:hypothetical protein
LPNSYPEKLAVAIHQRYVITPRRTIPANIFPNKRREREAKVAQSPMK